MALAAPLLRGVGLHLLGGLDAVAPAALAR
jgi:hypothetical protein